MDMIRQNANCDCFEALAVLDPAIDSSQAVDFIDQETARSVGKRDGEEVGATRKIRAAIIGHERAISYQNKYAHRRAVSVGTLRFAHPTIQQLIGYIKHSIDRKPSVEILIEPLGGSLS